jgi:Flp pilus assembly protein TadD
LQDDNSEEAVQLLSDAISLSSANHDLHFLRGTAYVKLEQWKEAVEDLEKVRQWRDGTGRDLCLSVSVCV